MTLAELKNYRSLSEKAEALREQVERLRSALEPGAVDTAKTPTGMGNPDKIAAGIARLEELQSKLRQEESRTTKRMVAVEAWLDALKPHERIIMRARYQKGMSWGDIAKKCSYSCGSSAYRVQYRIKKRGMLE